VARHRQSAAVAAVQVAIAVDVAAVEVATVVVAAQALAALAVEQEVADVAEAKSKNNDGESKTVKITLLRSVIGYPQGQRDAVRTLGLHRLHETVEHPDTPQLRGQIFKIKHLVEVEES
jgi:large subunit ribosomal protein L30